MVVKYLEMINEGSGNEWELKDLHIQNTPLKCVNTTNIIEKENAINKFKSK